MNRFLGGLAACAALTMAASAHADVKWTVTDASYGGAAVVVNGYFIQKTDASVVDFSLLAASTSTSDSFSFNPSTSYVDGVGAGVVSFQSTAASPNDNDQLYLTFDNDFLVANNPININGGYVIFFGSFNGSDIYFTGPPAGYATGQVIAVPEPTTWALMLGGVFGAGAMLRRRRATLPAV